jgi:hypothetical protein
MRRAIAALYPAAAALVLAPPPAAAWFESSAAGARAASLADAFVSVADDASSVYWNPAGMVQLRRHELLLATDRVARVAGIDNDFAAGVVHAPFASFGISWQHLAVESVLREDRLVLAAARTWIRRSLGAFVSTGVALEIAHVGLDPPPGIPNVRSGETGWAGSVGALLQPIPNVIAGVVARHLGQPEFDLVAGGERTRLDGEIEWGVSLRWREDARVHLSRLRTASGFTSTRIGGELQLVGPLGLRAGASRDTWSSGIAIALDRWTLDWSYRADAHLGATSQIGLRMGFGPVRDTVGGEYEQF